MKQRSRQLWLYFGFRVCSQRHQHFIAGGNNGNNAVDSIGTTQVSIGCFYSAQYERWFCNRSVRVMGRVNEPQKRPNKPEEKTTNKRKHKKERVGGVGVIDARS